MALATIEIHENEDGSAVIIDRTLDGDYGTNTARYHLTPDEYKSVWDILDNAQADDKELEHYYESRPDEYVFMPCDITLDGDSVHIEQSVTVRDLLRLVGYEKGHIVQIVGKHQTPITDVGSMVPVKNGDVFVSLGADSTPYA